LLGGFGDRARLGVVKVEAVDADLIAQLSNILLLARRANTRQPRAFISRAEARPMPEEQPVMRIERMLMTVRSARPPSSTSLILTARGSS
jgi:hypothetical protein